MPYAAYLRLLRHDLPTGAALYLFGPDGVVHTAAHGQVRRLDPTRRAEDRAAMLRFIDTGQYTRYLIGSAATSEANPTNATFKLGFVRPHSAFTPHAHGAEHFVLSMGYASCGLYDAAHARVAHIRLVPGALLHIPAHMPHSFNNRGAGPLPLVIANTGMGVAHEDYAITAAQAAERAQAGDASAAALLAALNRLADEMAASRAHQGVSWRERLGAGLRRLAAALEGAAR